MTPIDLITRLARAGAPGFADEAGPLDLRRRPRQLGLRCSHARPLCADRDHRRPDEAERADLVARVQRRRTVAEEDRNNKGPAEAGPFSPLASGQVAGVGFEPTTFGL